MRGPGPSAASSPPIPPDLITAAQREEMGRLARDQGPHLVPGNRGSLGPRLRDLERSLSATYRRLAAGGPPVEEQGVIVEWLLDNEHVVREALEQVRGSLPKGYYRRLPSLASATPRVDGLARRLVELAGRPVELEVAESLLDAYQGASPLSIGELWALPAFLRLAVLEDLGGIAAVAAAATEESAETLAGPGGTGDAGWAILALRDLAAYDWKAFFERASRVETILRQDPSGAYPRMSFETRDRYRKVVEMVARRSPGVDEETVARQAVELARAAPREGPAAPRQAHLGTYLVAEGRPRLEAKLDCRVPRRVRLGRRLVRRAPGLYLASVGLAWVAGLALPGVWLASLGVGGWSLGLALFLASGPGLGLAVSVINWLATLVFPPRVLPRLDAEQGIPEDARTLVVMPVIVSRRDEIATLLSRLEVHFLGNRDPAVSFALATDFADAPEQVMPRDEALLAAAADGIRRLNRQYGKGGREPFHLLHRERRWNPVAGQWMGWERKRGKLEELNLLLRGSRETSFAVPVAPPPDLEEIRYVVTLDADTRLPPGAAAELVATFAHPLNRPVLDPATGTLAAGYTVLQPRLAVDPSGANETRFTRIFAGEAGLDLYSRAISDVYQDLFGEAVFAGKGIYDVRAFERRLRGRVPENRLLSHDLFEGVHGRVGLVSEVVLFEDYPGNELLYARRLHRWVRGDWQLLPWLLPRVPAAGGGRMASGLSLLDRWKIVDNLRRSLFLPSVTGLFVVAWLALPAAAAMIATAGIAALLGAPIVLGALGEVRRGVAGRAWRPVIETAAHGVHLEGARWLLTLVSLPHLSVRSLDAVVRTGYRLAVSRKGLLEWTTAAHAARRIGARVAQAVAWREAAAGPLLATGLAVGLAVASPGSLPAAAPLLVLWLLSPQAVAWASRPVPRVREVLAAGGRRELRLVARRTWRFFEELVGPADQWLPPDHYQEEPGGVVARRTSPTNVAMLLLSTLAAHDLGYLAARDFASRIRATLDTLDGLAKHRGHWLNWYDTRSLAPLEPRYVSTVDSGNLAAAFLVLGHGLVQVRSRPVPNPVRFHGLADTVAVLGRVVTECLVREAGSESRRRARAVVGALAGLEEELREAVAAPLERRWGLVGEAGERLAGEIEAITSALEATESLLASGSVADLRAWAEHALAEARAAVRELEGTAPWLRVLARPPAAYAEAAPGSPLGAALGRLRRAVPAAVELGRIPRRSARARRLVGELDRALVDAGVPEARAGEARRWNRRMEEALDQAASRARSLLAELDELAARSLRAAEETDFAFLYDPSRDLFRIGFHVSSEELDANHYDLLVSEARIASFVAIAKGDAPVEHWLRLGRPVVRMAGSRVLLSWGGTMFEYLMPALLLRNPERTLLEESCRLAVRRQVAFAERQRIPWGISESGFADLGIHGDYQYRAFGVPGLGLKRELGDRLVVAPYASLLALPVRPRRVMENVDRLVALGALGRYGLFEAVDFGPAEGRRSREPRIVRSYMAHHQGMILVAAANHLAGNPMVERMHAEPRVASHELLLYERVPLEQPAPVRWARSEAAAAEPRGPEEPPGSARWEVPARGAAPRIMPLSNGVYGVLVSSGGGGVSRWRESALTRWRPDPTTEEWGTWIYLKDLDSGELWSPSLEPTGGDPAECSVFFSASAAELHRRRNDLFARCTVTVAERDHAEIRTLHVTNEADRSRRLFVASYGEVVLGPEGEDRRHPAFSKLFVEGEYRPEARTLLFRRRARSPGQPAVLLGHALVAGRAPLELCVETDRARFLGRGRNRRAPLALDDPPRGFSGTTGATLDPIFSLGCLLEVPSGETAELAFVTAAGESEDEVLRSLAAVSSPRRIEWAFDRARARSDAELRELRIPAGEVRHLVELLSFVLAPRAGLRRGLDDAGPIEPVLWSRGISGNLPIVLVRVTENGGLGLVRQALRGHAWWRSHRVEIDLVILDEVSRGYERPLQERLERAAAEIGRRARVRGAGRAIVVAADELGAARRELLAAARVVLETGAGSLGEQLARGEGGHAVLPELVLVPGPKTPGEELPDLARPAGLLLDNGLGGFLPAPPGGAGYEIFLEPGRLPPAPWVNVIANPGFGCLISESGASCTWTGTGGAGTGGAANSGELRLTPWSNDPVTEPIGEALFLRDEETAAVWSATPLPAPSPAPYEVRHAPGRTVFRHRGYGLDQELEVFVDRSAPVKIVVLRLRDLWQRPRRITATYHAEWVLGAVRERSGPFVVPEFEPKTGALLARTVSGPLAGEGVAFLAASRPVHGLTTDRAEWLGPERDPARPFPLRRIGLSGAVRAGLDPCVALQVHLDVAAGEAAEVHFLLGMGRSRKEALELVRRFREPAAAHLASERVTGAWEDLLGRIVVETPDPGIDRMLNRWLPYQAVACRLWARTALYQSSGAYGFRDQLQDAANLAPIAPELAREQIVRAAAHQFEEGDVLHWWHPGSGDGSASGVRTRYSDDLLWLPWAAARYLEVTGDASILDERVPYLVALELEADEVERYGSFAPGGRDGTVYEHCLRALERGSTRGPHGLPLIGGGDWNDGMNRLGLKGRGESVWLGWFLCAVLRDVAPLSERAGEPERALGLRGEVRELAAALEEHAWDGAWYRRAYDDDGHPIGSAGNDECRIDLIAQAWAVLSGAGDPARAANAMASAREHLLRREDGLLLLLAPPFDRAEPDPGYIRAYPPGIRENGGQYTHGAVWGAWAFAKLGDGDLAVELLRMLLPVSKAGSPEGVERYRVEPYVAAADVYGVPPHRGRGGWTWYTGAAAWLWRYGIEAVLGLRRRGHALEIDPCIARGWPGFRAEVREGGTLYEIRVENPEGVCRGVRSVELDGRPLEGSRIPLEDDGLRHQAVVRLGCQPPASPGRRAP
jgi:cyclic beta-1,2-glucan synthetase